MERLVAALNSLSFIQVLGSVLCRPSAGRLAELQQQETLQLRTGWEFDKKDLD